MFVLFAVMAELAAGSVHPSSVLMGSSSGIGVAQPIMLTEGNGTSINGAVYPIRETITAPRFIDIYSAINVSTIVMPIVDPVSLLRTYSGTLFVSYNNTGNFIDAGQCYNFSYGQHTIVCRYKNNAKSPIGFKTRGALFFKIRVNSTTVLLGSDAKNMTGRYTRSYNTSASRAVVIENLTLTPESTVVFTGQPVTFTNRTTKSGDKYTNYTYTVKPDANFTRVGNTFVFSHAGEYTVTLEASTSNGKEHVKDSVKMHIMPPFVNYGVTMVVPENVIYNGLSETLRASVSGGVAPYTYLWMVNGNKVGTNASTLEFYANATTLANSPDAIAVQVTDGSGNTVAANAAIAVYSNQTGGNIHAPRTIDEYWAINVSTIVMPIVDPVSLLRTYSGTLFVSYNNTGNFIDAGQCYNFSYGQHTIVCRYKNNAKSPIGFKTRGALFFKIRVNSTTVLLGSDAKNMTGRYTRSYNTSASRAVVIENLTLTPESTVVFTGQPVTFTNRTTKSGDKYTNYTYTVKPDANFTRVGNTFVFSHAGEYTVTLEASTSNGKEHVKDSVSMVVLPPPGEFAVKLDVPYKIIMADRNETITANVSGGDSHYAYSWSINGKPVGENSSVLDFVGNASTISGSPDIVTVYVKDGSGLEGEASAVVRVSPIFIGSTGRQTEPIDINGSTELLARSYNGSQYGVADAVVRDAMGMEKWWARYLS